MTEYGHDESEWTDDLMFEERFHPVESYGYYCKGGYHPIKLGDCLDNGRYVVIHKLGFGNSATIWLCRDLFSESRTRYVAVKIMAAEVMDPEKGFNYIQYELQLMSKTEQKEFMKGSEHLCPPLDVFITEGPNGSHYCFVFPVLGPRAFEGHRFRDEEDPDEILRGACTQLVQAVNFLHKLGICHGAITSKNVLHRVSGLDGLSEAEVLEILGQPRMDEYIPGPECPDAPKYLVMAVIWDKVKSSDIIEKDVCLVNLGKSYMGLQRQDYILTDRNWRAPEIILENEIGFPSDIWALGHTLFHIRTGRWFVETYEVDECLIRMTERLGPMPEPWWSTTWRRRREIFEDEPDEDGRAVFCERVGTIPNLTYHPAFAEIKRSLYEALGPGVDYIDFSGHEHREIDEEEKKIFADLLEQILRWDPKSRIDTTTMLEHKFFSL